MHIYRFYGKCNRHILVIGKKASSIFEQSIRVCHIFKNSRFHNTAVFSLGSLIHKFSASVINGLNSKILITNRDQHGEHFFCRSFFRNIQNIGAELNILNGAIAGF